MKTRIWKRADCVSAEVEDSLVLLDLESLAYHALNGTAAAIWGLLETPRSSPEIAGILCTRYKVEPEQSAHAVDRLLGELSAINLVLPVEQETAGLSPGHG